MPDYHLPRLPPLGPLRAFHAAATLGSFKAAASALNLTPSAVSHAIRGLEKQLDLTLFHRLNRRLVLSRDGDALLAATTQAFDLLVERIGALTRRGRRLHISALPLIADVCLMPRLAEFQAAHPDVELSLDTTTRLVDVAGGESDMAIRFSAGPWPGLASEPLLTVSFAPVCAPEIARRLRHPADLAGETLIYTTPRHDAWDTWFAATGAEGLKPGRKLTVDSTTAAYNIAARGGGVALGFFPLLNAHLGRLGLVEVTERRQHGGAYHLVWRPADTDQPEIAACRAWLHGLMADLVK
jgi:LysR family glycine cleavage system transcriptional activator